MINAELGHVTTLDEFYTEIVKQQTTAHGEHYCDHHSKIKELSSECRSYSELGTHQGATAARAMLSKFDKIKLVDTDISRYRKFLEPIATQYCLDNNKTLEVFEGSSIDNKSTLETVDLLFIDSMHKSSHMKKELNLHAKNVKKYILAHDTHRQHGRINTSLYETLESFCKTNPWEVAERNTVAEGYTLLKRKSQ